MPKATSQSNQKSKKKDKPKVWTITVGLNGTDTNPYHKLGLTRNPFPELGKSEWDAAELQMHKLGGDPIPQDNPEAYIREVLAGFSSEFVDLCVQNFRPGKYVKFKVFWPRES